MNARPVWPLAVLLVVWGNVVPALLGGSALLPGGSWAFVVAGTALIVVSVVAARLLGLGPADLGLVARHAPRGAAIGALAGVVALAGVGLIRLAPLLIGQRVAYGPVAGVPDDALVRHLAFFLPLGAVVPEELAFRGALLGALARRHGERAALLGSAAAFALWHAAVIVTTIRDTTLAPPSPWAGPAMLGALAVVFGGGVLFAALRLRTRTLAATIVAHWMFNAVVLVGLRGAA